MKPRLLSPRLLRLSPLVLAAVLLAACEPSADTMGNLKGPMPPVPPPIVVRDQHRHLAMELPLSGTLGPAERRRIGSFLAHSAAGRPEAVHLTIAGNPPPAVVDAVARTAFALGYREDRIKVTPPRFAHGARRTLELVTAAYVPVLPNCPETQHLNIIDGNNMVSSDLGCSSVADLELQVANPRDLVRGENGGETDSVMTTAAIKRLETNKLKKMNTESTTAATTGGGQ